MKALVTGGAGFIGSHLADVLVAQGHQVRVLDNFFSGNEGNVGPEVELVEGDVADEAAVTKAVDGVEIVFHQAAHRAVLRSVEQPLATDLANTHGTLTVLKAAADAGARRVVCASSSSVYGGSEILPTPESAPLLPRSPYAVSKLAGEHYCRVFADLFGIETVSLRYFNVYGPRQRPDSAYAAVIPLFIKALAGHEAPVVHGDGRQSRAFVYVSDAVAANIAAMNAPVAACHGQAYNIAGTTPVDLLELLNILARIMGVEAQPIHTEPRPGDVRHTSADVSAARAGLGHEPQVELEDGLRRTVEWFTATAGPTNEQPRRP